MFSSPQNFVQGVPPNVNFKHLHNKPNLLLNNKPKIPELDLPNFLNYVADLSGCGFWRIKWPEYLLNILQKAHVTTVAQMIFDPRFYKDLKSIRFQRQATTIQKKFFDDLKKLKQEFKYRTIYEIDDIVFGQDIPDYNAQKKAFQNEEINSNILHMMQNCDEMTVSTSYIKDYYKNKTGHTKITVLPCYIPRFWAGRFFNKNKIDQNFNRNKKRPRILYAGSATHLKQKNMEAGILDDFSHVVKDIIKARKDFVFVWKGCFPAEVYDYVKSGEMEFHPWSKLCNTHESISDLNCNAAYAPLNNNLFNECKANIKMLEAGAHGLPGAYQNIEPYKDAQFKFNNGAELIDQLKLITSKNSNYMQLSQKAYDFTNEMWLEDHILEHFDVYNYEWGSKERNLNTQLIKNNNDQKI